MKGVSHRIPPWIFPSSFQPFVKLFTELYLQVLHFRPFLACADACCTPPRPNVSVHWSVITQINSKFRRYLEYLVFNANLLLNQFFFQLITHRPILPTRQVDTNVVYFSSVRFFPPFFQYFFFLTVNKLKTSVCSNFLIWKQKPPKKNCQKSMEFGRFCKSALFYT